MSSITHPAIRYESAYSPFQTLLLECIEWEKKRGALSEKCSVDRPGREVSYAQETSDKTLKEIRKWISVLSEFNKPSFTHPGLFKEVAWLLGNKPFFVKALLVDTSLRIGGQNMLVEIVFDYYFKNEEPLEEETIVVCDYKRHKRFQDVHDEEAEKRFPTNKEDREFRFKIILDNLKLGYYLPGGNGSSIAV